MKRSRGCLLTALALLTVSACGDGPTVASEPPCTADTGTVTASVTAEQPAVFDWEAACAVALLLIEEDASDQWGISTDEETWTSPDLANRIFHQSPTVSCLLECPRYLTIH